MTDNTSFLKMSPWIQDKTHISWINPKKKIDILINKKKKLIAAAIIILLYLVAWTKISSACCCSVAIWLFVSTSLLTSLSENGCSEPPPTDHVVSHHLLPPVAHIAQAM